MKKYAVLLLFALVLTVFTACGADEYEIIAGQKQEIPTTVILDESKHNISDEILGSWYYVGENAHFMEFFADGTAVCEYIPDITYTYTFDGETLTLTTPDFIRTYPCSISEDGYLSYTWDDKGTLTTETCEKRTAEE